MPGLQTWTLRRPDDIAGYTGTLPNPKMEPVGVIKELLKGLSKVDEVCAPHPGSNAANCVTAEKCVSVQPQLLRLRPPRSDPRCLHDGFSQCETTGSSRFSPTQPSRCRSHSCRSKSSVQLWTRARTAFSSTDTKRTRSCSQHSGITSSTQWMMQLSHVRLPFLKWHAVANRSEVIPQTQFEEADKEIWIVDTKLYASRDKLAEVLIADSLVLVGTAPWPRCCRSRLFSRVNRND